MNSRQTTVDEALDGWLQRVNALCGRFCAKALGPEFAGAIEQYRGGALQMSFVDIAHARLYRTPQEVAANDGKGYYAVFQLAGSACMAQDAQRIVLNPGDITLIDSARPSDFSYGAGARQLSLILPREVVERSLRFAAVRSCEVIAAHTPVAVLANSLVHESARQEGLSLLESEATLDALVSLLRPAISASEDVDDLHERLFRRALAFIERHICEPELCPELLAREIGVSLRGLYRMFARKELVVAQYIRNRRLDLCAEALRHAGSDLKLSALGYAWGFSDSSYFSTAFKARFGVSPGEYRKRHRPDG